MIDTIFIALTPFHVKSFRAKYGEEFSHENVLILHDVFVKEDSLKELKGEVMPLPNIEFRIYDFFEKPFKSISVYRKRIKEIRRFSQNLLNSRSFSKKKITINIASDRDIFTQVFLNVLYKKFNDRKLVLNAFDEGSGFYDNKQFFDKIKYILFPILSPIFFGEKLNFNKPMGRDKRIDEIFCRFPEFISKNNHSKYTKLDVRENRSTGTYNPKSRKTLVFGFPLKDRNIPLSDKKKWLVNLYNKLDVDQFVLKLHPREEIFDIPEINLEILPSDFPLEQLNYFDYKYIVNFSSSIIMDLLASDFPRDKIITVSFGAKFNIASFYESTRLIKTEDLEK